MADVRALLRDELAARRDTEEGSTSAARGSKKRKLDSEQAEIRKRQRPTDSPSPPGDKKDRDDEPLVADAVAEPPVTEDIVNQTSDLSEGVQTPAERLETEPEPVDDDEWAAFEREVVAPSRVPTAAAAALSTNATISAAPVSASELAERERQEGESRSTAQETRILGEREDATRHLEEEFDEMEELEEKVRRLKKKRDEIRRHKDESTADAGNDSMAMETGQTMAATLTQEESDEESEPDDDWDNWRFRRGR